MPSNPMAKTINLCGSILPLSITCCLLLLLPNPSHSADPDPLQDFCIADLKAADTVTSGDFFFDGLTREGDTSNPLRSSVTLGLSMSRVDIAPGGVTQPHLHPRAAEVGVLIAGKLLVGLVTTGNVVYSKNVSAGEVFPIPRGLVHFVMNVGGEKALAFIAYNSQKPGTIQISRNLFSADVPDQVLMKAFQVNQTVVDEIRSRLSQ